MARASLREGRRLRILRGGRTFLRVEQKVFFAGSCGLECDVYSAGRKDWIISYTYFRVVRPGGFMSVTQMTWRAGSASITAGAVGNIPVTMVPGWCFTVNLVGNALAQ